MLPIQGTACSGKALVRWRRWLTVEVFGILGVRPLLGRAFGPEDGAPGAPATLVLSHGLWQSRFGGEPDVLGRDVLVDGAPHVVIGVTPRCACSRWPSSARRLASC